MNKKIRKKDIYKKWYSYTPKKTTIRQHFIHISLKNALKRPQIEQELSYIDGSDVKRTITGQFDISSNFENELSFSQFNLVAQLCPTLCDPWDCSMPGFPVHHQLPKLAKTQAHWISDAIQPSHPLSSPSPPTFNLS